MCTFCLILFLSYCQLVNVDGCAIPISGDVIFIIQGIANTPATPDDAWHIPSAHSRRNCIGLKPHGGNGFSGGGVMLPNDAKEIKDLIKENSTSYGVPEDRIPKIT